MDIKTEKIIVKFLAKEANLEELRQLELWIRNPENEHLFNEYFKANHYANTALKTYDLEIAKNNILQQINRRKAKSNYIYKYAVAATLALILTTTYFFGDNLFNTTAKDVVSPTISPLCHKVDMYGASNSSASTTRVTNFLALPCCFSFCNASFPGKD